MNDDPEWTTILDVVYRENIVWDPGKEFDEEHPVVSATNMGPETVQENLSLLDQSGLVGRVHVGRQADVPRPDNELLVGIDDDSRQRGTHVGLTSRGFHVAHERDVMDQQQKEQDKRIQGQNEINSAIGYLTLGLLFINFVDTWVSATLANGMPTWPLSTWIGLFSSALVVTAVAILLRKSELLEPYSSLDR